MPDGITPQPPAQPLNFDHIPGHQIHDDASIAPPPASDEDKSSQGIRALGMIPYTEPEELSKALEHVTSAIENYTQGGRAQHPILSKLGDATRAAKEYLTGGQSAGQPMGTKYGVINNPVTQAISVVPSGAEDATAAEAKVREYAPKVAEHVAETGRTLRSSLAEDFHGWRNARAPQGSTEAGAIPMGKPARLNFDNIEGHQDIEPLPGKEKTTETVNIPPKTFIDKVSRGKISPDVVNAKRAQIRAGEELPPAKIWYDAEGNVVGADGRHRALAHMQENSERMPVDIIREKPEEKPVTGNPQVAEGAQRYNASIGKGPIVHEPTPLGSQESRNALADAYDAMEHNPNDPRVKAAYQAMKDETKAQFNHIKNDMGIKIDFTKEDPYKSAEDMQADVRNNHHLSVFTGGESQADHPASEIDKETGQTYQNLFRATHDIFGHAAGGFDFSEAGENSAYGAHMQMFSPEAQPAVQHETQGQANWFFNNQGVRNGKPLGDFPPQKAAVLPEGFGKKPPSEATISPIMETAKVFGDQPFTADSMKLYTNINDPAEITKTLDYLADTGKLEKTGNTYKMVPEQAEGAAPTQANSAQQAVEAAGGVYRGQNKDGMVEVTLPESMTKDLNISEPLKKFVSVTFAPGEDVTPETVRAAMDRKVREYGGVPEETNIVKTTGPQHLERLPENSDYPGTVVADIHHELGHIVLGDEAGLSIRGGIRSDRHPSARAVGAAAQTRFDYSSWTGRKGSMDYEEVRPHLDAFLRILMGGGAAEEAFHAIPMTTNGGMGDDLKEAYSILRGLGYSSAEAEGRVMAAQAQAKNVLTQPGLRDMFERHTAAREEGLNENYHMSKRGVNKFLEEFRSLHDRNQQAGRNLGGNPAEIAGVNQELDTGTKGASAQGTRQKAAGQQLVLPGVSKANTPTGENAPQAGGYHPALQALAEAYGTSDDPGKIIKEQATFLAPDGKVITSGVDHPTAIAGKADFTPANQLMMGDSAEGDVRVPFINETGAIRARYMGNDKAGKVLTFSVPKTGVTPEQVEMMKQSLGKTGRYTQLRIERADVTPETKDSLSKMTDFASPNDVDKMLNEIGAHPNDWTRKAANAMMEAPAGAINPRTGEVVTPEMATAPDAKEKFGVEVYPEARAARKPLDHPPTPEDVRAFHKEHEALFDRHPELRVGWDKTDAGWEMNIGAAGPTQAGAELVGKNLDQRAAWDIANQQEIPTQGANVKTKFPQYSLKDRLDDLTGRNVAKLPPTVKFSPHLTDTEKHVLASSPTDLRDYKTIKKKIAGVQDIAESAVAGTANRFWYERAKSAFDAVFDSLPKGSFPEDDRNKFIGLVAATSPRTDVVENMASALNAYRAWVEEGRPTDPSRIREAIDSSLMMKGSHGPNAARALTNQPLSGPKVTAFRESFLGSASHVTNDMWGAITNGIDPQELGSEGAYMALSENYRKAAESLGWEPKQGAGRIVGIYPHARERCRFGWKLAGKDRETSAVIGLIDDPMVRKYSADIADIFLNSEKVRSRLEGLGINLEEFDGKLRGSITDYGRGGESSSGRLSPKVATRTAERIEEAKERAATAVRAGKKVNPKASPLLNQALGGEDIKALASGPKPRWLKAPK